MGIPILNNLDFNKNEAQNLRIHNLATAPSSPVVGQIYYNTATAKLMICTNATGPVWAELSVGSGYTHPSGFTSQPGTALSAAAVISQVTVNGEGHVTGIAQRNLTPADIAASPTNHNLVNTTHHPVSGLTTGHFLKATGATAYGFGAHGLTAGSVGAAAIMHNLIDTTNHPVMGLTTGHFLKATAGDAYGFGVHGLAAADVGAAPSSHVGEGGAAHATATGSATGFMATQDKNKLDNATTDATVSTLMMRDVSGRSQVVAPVVAGDIATKGYVDGILGANDAMVYKGVINASANPNYPAADAGHTYRISVAGKIGGASGPNVEVGDLIICLTDATASNTHAIVGANWNIVQANLDGAVIGPASATTDRIAAFDGTSGKLIKDSGILVTSMLKKYTTTVGGSTSASVTHNLNTRNIIVSVHTVASPFTEVMCEIEKLSTNQITLLFATAPSAASLEVTVIG